MIKPNDTIIVNNNIRLRVIDKLGEGGQGHVYIVQMGDNKYALKLLYDYSGNIVTKDNAIAVNIETLINSEPPSDCFIWPKYSIDYNGQYGYLMNLIPSNYKELSLWLNADPSMVFGSTIALIDMSINIIQAINALRVKGYSYQDLNASNIMVNPRDGSIKICDCDNICPTSQNYGVTGKKGYQAPEVVMGKRPDIYSDIFSLTLMLYYIWCKDNPFDGAHTLSIPFITEEISQDIYGFNPVFTWHPYDDSNRPVKDVHNGSYYLWPLLPAYIRSGFVKTFTEGIRNIQNGRLPLKQWIKNFLQFRSSIIICSFCKEENIYSGQDQLLCDKCNNDITPKHILQFNDYTAPAYEGAKIYKYYISDDKDSMYEIIGELVANKKYPSIIGVRNLSDIDWQEHRADGRDNIATKGYVLIITNGTIIDFNNTSRCTIKQI